MNKLLHKVYPLLSFYFGPDGISATQANARKNENTNENINLMRDLQNVALYETHMTIVSDQGTQTNKVAVRKVTPAHFDVLDQVAKNNGENALLGNGIKLFNQALEQIKTIDAKLLVEMADGDTQLPEIKPLAAKKVAVTDGNIDSVLQMERVEDILIRCKEETLQRLDADMLKKALRLESEAAVLGNELTKKECFLQRIISAEPELATTETVANFAMVIKQPKLAYSTTEIDDFKAKFDNLQKRYQNLQGQLNGLKKQIKDCIRLTETDFVKEYAANLAVYQQEQREYQNKWNQINTQGETIRQQLIQELLTLKISIA
jgi:hypothetical protein